LLDDPGRRDRAARRIEEVAPAFRWAEAAQPLLDYCLHHSERPRPRKPPGAVARAIYGQYPAMLADVMASEGPVELGRRMARHAARALRHGI
jgi:hypothetical protein